MSAHGQPLVPSLAPLHRLEGRMIDEVRVTRVNDVGDEVEVSLYLDDGASVRFLAREIIDYEIARTMPDTGIIGATLLVEVVG